MPSDVDREIEALFEDAPDRFTAARDALAKRLRAEGDGERAAEVKRLKRPTVAAWAVNLLARREPKRVEALLAAGDRLRRAQRAALSGKGGTDLREAAEERRKLVASLADRAGELLEAEGTGRGPHVDDISATLEAASADESVGDELRSGRLQRTLSRPAGFGDVSGLQVLAAPAEEEPERAGPRVDPRRMREAQEEVRAAERDERRVRTTADRLRARLEDLEASVAEAKDSLKSAQADVRGAELRTRRARKQLDRLSGPR